MSSRSGREHEHQQQRDDEVERALDRVVEAVEDRRAQLEQRHRRAGHELGAVHEDLHRRRRDPHRHAALVARVDEVDRALLREVGVGDDHLLHAVHVEHRGDVLDPAERAQPVVGPRRQRHEADHLDRRVHLVLERVRDVLDVLARADEHGAAAVAGQSQQDAGDLLVAPPQRADEADPERQRAVEDVVARVLLAVDEREDERDDGDLEERGDDPRQAGPLGARGVQPGAGEQQHREQIGEGDGVARLVHRRRPRPLAVAQHGLDHERDVDRREHADEVEHEQREHAQARAQRLHPQQEREGRRALAAHVDPRQVDLDRPYVARALRRLGGDVCQSWFPGTNAPGMRR